MHSHEKFNDTHRLVLDTRHRGIPSFPRRHRPGDCRAELGRELDHVQQQPKCAPISDVAEIRATKSGDPTNTKLLHVASGRSPIPTEEIGTNSCLPAGQFYLRFVTDFIVLLTDGWDGRFACDLAGLKAAGAEITDACAETGIVEGVIASADLNALSRLPCVDRVTQGLTYLCESRSQVDAGQGTTFFRNRTKQGICHVANHDPRKLAGHSRSGLKGDWRARGWKC